MKKIQKQNEKIDQIINFSYNQSNRRLYLSYQYIHWKNILPSRNWEHLKILYLHLCKVKGPEVDIITKLNWPNLQKLVLNKKDQNQIKEEGALKLFSKEWPSLTTVSLESNLIKMKILLPLSNKYCISPQLLCLNLRDNPLGSQAGRILSKMQLHYLKQIDVGKCKLNNQGIKHLGKSKWLQLVEISLDENQITFEGFEQMNSFQLATVTYMNICKNKEYRNVLNFMATNFPRNATIDNPDRMVHNQFFKNQIPTIMKSKFSQ